jgi:tetratricopeptide (TPR) repeat protein
MSLWNSMSAPGGLRPIVQKSPMPSAAPARVALAKPAAKSAAPAFQAALTAAAKPAAPPPPPPAPASTPSTGLPKASSLDPARLQAALRAPRPAPAAPPVQPRPVEAFAFLRRAVVAQQRGDHAAALVEFGKAVELDPLCVEAYTGRGISKEVLGDVEGAKRDYAKGIQIEVNAEIARQAWRGTDDPTRIPT